MQVHGQQEIHQRIMQLNFRDCKAKIKHVDAHSTLANGVVVQVGFEVFLSFKNTWKSWKNIWPLNTFVAETVFVTFNVEINLIWSNY